MIDSNRVQTLMCDWRNAEDDRQKKAAQDALVAFMDGDADADEVAEPPLKRRALDALRGDPFNPPDVDAAVRAVAEYREGSRATKPFDPQVAEKPEHVVWRVAEGVPQPAVSAGSVGVLGGCGGLGKSLLALQIALAAARAEAEGLEFGEAAGLRVKPGRVVVVSYEAGREYLTHKILLMLRDGEQPPGPDAIRFADDLGPLYELGPDRLIAPSPDWRRLWNDVRTIRPALVVIDPAKDALGGVSVSEDTGARALTRGLMVEAKASGCGVLLVAHDTKAARDASSKGDNPGAGAVSGSSAWHDAARSVAYMWREGDRGYRTLKSIKSNLGRSGWEVELGEVVNEATLELVGFKDNRTEAPKRGGDSWLP